MAVSFGAAGAFIVHVVIATTVGVVLFRVVPHRTIEGLVAEASSLAHFLPCARWRESGEAKTASSDSSRPRSDLIDKRRSPLSRSSSSLSGDLTQILTANLAVHYHSPVSVGFGALAALWTVAAIAVMGGKGMPRFVSVITIRKATAAVLLVLAALAAWSAAR
jgi:putative Ca2+/H+ antiporter (TMEM165/GDT1 family)